MSLLVLEFGRSDSARSVDIGQGEPTWVVLADPEGNEFCILRAFTPEEMKGKVWLLNVWASWCVACQQEHPRLVDMSKKKIVPIVGLNYKDQREAGIGDLRVAQHQPDERFAVQMRESGVGDVGIRDALRHTRLLAAADIRQRDLRRAPLRPPARATYSSSGPVVDIALSSSRMRRAPASPTRCTAAAITCGCV